MVLQYTFCVSDLQISQIMLFDWKTKRNRTEDLVLLGLVIAIFEGKDNDEPFHG